MNTVPARPLRIVVLISGGGTTLKNLIAHRDAGRLNVEIPLVLSNNPKAGGQPFALEADIPYEVIERNRFASQDAFSEALFGRCRDVDADLVVLGGFLKQITVPDDFANRVINIHPALIPAFCGKGMYGHYVHEAALQYGVKLTGCTVHFVDNQYDHGPVILQKAVPVLDHDTTDMLAARVFEAECEAYPAAIGLIATGRVTVEGRRVRIAGE